MCFRAEKERSHCAVLTAMIRDNELTWLIRERQQLKERVPWAHRHLHQDLFHSNIFSQCALHGKIDLIKAVRICKRSKLIWIQKPFASYCSSASKLAILSSMGWMRLWKWNLSTITKRLGWKCELSTSEIRSNGNVLGTSGATRSCKSEYVQAPIELRRVGTHLSSSIPFAAKYRNARFK